LLREGNIDAIIHFDPPLTPAELDAAWEEYNVR
jgi:hypothetical protein